MKKSDWRDVKSAPDGTEVDVWLQVPASPRSFGMSDAWRVTEAWLRDGKWFHRQGGAEMEIHSDYVTHWMPIPSPPKNKR